MGGVDSYKDLHKEVQKQDSDYAKFKDIVTEIDQLKNKDKEDDVIDDKVLDDVLTGTLRKHLLENRQVAMILYHEICGINTNKLDSTVQKSVNDLKNCLWTYSYTNANEHIVEIKWAKAFLDQMKGELEWIKGWRENYRENIDGASKEDVKALYNYVKVTAERNFEDLNRYFEGYVNRIVVDEKENEKQDLLKERNGIQNEFFDFLAKIKGVYDNLPSVAVNPVEHSSTSLKTIDRKWNNINQKLVSDINNSLWQDNSFLSLDESGNLLYDSEKLNNFLNSINEDNFWDYWKVDRGLHIICDRTNWRAMNIAVQILFNEKDDANLTVNGFWQPNSQYYNKIKDYQKTNKIEPADGKLNFATFDKLRSSSSVNG